VTSVGVAELAQPATVKIDALTQDVDAPVNFQFEVKPIKANGELDDGKLALAKWHG